MFRFRFLGIWSVCLALPVLSAGCADTSPGTAKSTAKPRDLATIGDAQLDEAGDLVGLTLFHSDVTDADLQQLEDYPKLESLLIQECKQISDEGLRGLRDAKALTSLVLIRVPVSDAALPYLSSASSLTDVQLAHTNVTGAGLQHLTGLPIAKLAIQSQNATPEGLSSVAQLTSLQHLELDCPNVPFEELVSLSALTNLQSLVMVRTPLGATGLDRIRGLAALQRLVVDGRNVGDEAIDVLNTLQGLQEVSVSEAEFTDEGLARLKLPNVTHLALKGCLGVTDAGLGNLAGLPSLTHLDVTESGVSGIDLTGLKSVPMLRELTMSGEQFRGNQESLDALKELLPNCNVQILRG